MNKSAFFILFITTLFLASCSAETPTKEQVLTTTPQKAKELNQQEVRTTLTALIPNIEKPPLDYQATYTQEYSFTNNKKETDQRIWYQKGEKTLQYIKRPTSESKLFTFDEEYLYSCRTYEEGWRCTRKPQSGNKAVDTKRLANSKDLQENGTITLAGKTGKCYQGTISTEFSEEFFDISCYSQEGILIYEHAQALEEELSFTTKLTDFSINVEEKFELPLPMEKVYISNEP